MVAASASAPSWKRLRFRGVDAGGRRPIHQRHLFCRDDRRQWRVEPGLRARELEADTRAAFPLTLTFDGQQPFNIHGVPVADKVVRVPMPTNSALIAQFRKARACGAVPAAAGYRDQVVDRARPRAERPDSPRRHDDPAARGLGAGPRPGSCRPLPRPPFTSCGREQPGHSSYSSLRWRGFAGPSLAAAGSAAHTQR